MFQSNQSVLCGSPRRPNQVSFSFLFISFFCLYPLTSQGYNLVFSAMSIETQVVWHSFQKKHSTDDS